MSARSDLSFRSSSNKPLEERHVVWGDTTEDPSMASCHLFFCDAGQWQTGTRISCRLLRRTPISPAARDNAFSRCGLFLCVFQNVLMFFFFLFLLAGRHQEFKSRATCGGKWSHDTPHFRLWLWNLPRQNNSHMTGCCWARDRKCSPNKDATQLRRQTSASCDLVYSGGLDGALMLITPRDTSFSSATFFYSSNTRKIRFNKLTNQTPGNRLSTGCGLGLGTRAFLSKLTSKHLPCF